MKSSTSTYVFIWFGASVSLAEILTGTFFAPLGFEQGVAAIVIGHIIGCVLFGLAAYMGAKTNKTAMETVKLSFGKRGSLVFSLSNVIQLIGWTSIMIFSGAAAAHYLVPHLGEMSWCVIIGALVVVWVALSLKNMSRVQTTAVLLLAGLCLIMSFNVFGGAFTGEMPVEESSIGFGAAVELAVAMPLSWLPVVSDYMRHAQKPKRATVAATLAYFFGSTWMFILGLGAALFAGSTDITHILGSAGLGVVGIVVVIFSTVTTTFLDAASVGFSARSIFPRLNAKGVGIAAAIFGTLLAMLFPVARFEDFLYLIGSIFAPMIAIMIVDFYIRRSDSSYKKFDVVSLMVWLFGFILYRVSMSWDIACGNTLPVIIIVGLATYGIHKLIQLSHSPKNISKNRKGSDGIWTK